MKTLIFSLMLLPTIGVLSASGEAFVEELLAKMTLEEKVGQCVQLSSSGEKGQDAAESSEAYGVNLRSDVVEWVKRGEVGSLIGCCGIKRFNALQKIAREESRLGIPLLVGHDMIHGVKTQFPIGPALACLWDEETWERCGRLIALETPLKGCNWTFAPMLDISRDPRWGRIAESPGQDPLIGARMGAAFVRGIQSKDVAMPVAACLKHYIGYGASFAGRDYAAVEMSESTLRNVYLPPFKAAVAAGALTVMPAFHTFNGVPCSVNRWLLTDILRGELGFSGFCISDYNAVGECQWTGCHGVAENNDVDVSAMAVHAGMDMDMMSKAYSKGLAQAVRSGKLPEAELNEAVRRILTVKKALGLWENPFIDEKAVTSRVDLKAHAALAREVGARCCVLLKNEKGVLPLKAGANVLLVGPGAEDVANLCGAWSKFRENRSCALVTEGLADDGVAFTYVQGYDFTKPGVDTAAIDEAAAKADVIVAIFGEDGRESGEGKSLLRLELPSVQLEALRHLKTLKKPLVALLSGGRPRAIPELAAEADALLDVWNLGTSAGGAIADVLTGKVNPEGRLTTEIPYATGQLPLFYNRTATGRPTEESGVRFASCYQDGPHQALYPFGFGLSYTTFAYANERVEIQGDQVVFEADVTNTGQVEGVETVQAYTRDLVGVESRPICELRGWQRLRLKPGETAHAKIVVPVTDLAYWAKDRLVPAEGEHWATIAPDSVSGKRCSFVIEKKQPSACGRRMRLLYWNIQNGMWDGQGDDYARFVDFVKAYDPDVCVWCEAQSIFVTGSDKERLAENERFLPNGWKELAARYGHANVFLGGHRDNYPQVITSKLPLEGVRRLYGPDGQRIRHGAGWATVKVGNRTVNIVTVHCWPQQFAPGVPDKAAERKSRREHGGDHYRRYEIEEICRETIFTQTNTTDACWIMLGDFNSLTRTDNHVYKLADDDTKFLPHDFLREKTPYRDILALQHPGVLRSTCAFPRRRIDFVYLTQPLVDAVRSADVIVDGYTSNRPVPDCGFYTPSDHLPILVDFDFGLK